MQLINALLLGVIGCTAFAPRAPPRPSTAVASKKKFKAAGGGFGAAPREKGRSEKPFKSQVVDAHNGFEKWRGDEAAEVTRVHLDGTHDVVLKFSKKTLE